MSDNTVAAKPSNWNVPNILTVIRIILVPVYVVLLFMGPWMMHESVVFTQNLLHDLPRMIQNGR